MQGINQRTPTEPKNTKKKIISIISIMFVFIILFMGGFLVANYGKKNMKIDSVINNTADTEINSPDVMNKSKIQEIRNAIENYYVANGSYPKTLEELKSTNVSVFGDVTDLTVYTYSTADSGKTYSISFRLEDQQDTDENTMGTPPNKIYLLENAQ